jgi:hypothetical protein
MRGGFLLRPQDRRIPDADREGVMQEVVALLLLREEPWEGRRLC